MLIETERLFLREMNKDDFNALYNVLAATEIMKYYFYCTFDYKCTVNMKTAPF